jgi:hypothetical protein
MSPVVGEIGGLLVGLGVSRCFLGRGPCLSLLQVVCLSSRRLPKLFPVLFLSGWTLSSMSCAHVC